METILNAINATSTDGYWGVPTSSVDWCEQNYIWSHYIAEWWNSWSNVPPFLLALGGMIAATSSTKTVRQAQPQVIFLAYLVLIVVFAGSFIFHATLTYFGQLLDELPMLYGQLYFHYLYSRKYKYAKLGCLLVGVIITASMILFRDSPYPLQVSFTALTMLLLIRSVLAAKEMGQQNSSNMLRLSAAFNVAACILWLLDQSFCSYVQGMFFHAGWHLLQGLAGFVWIQFACAYELVRTDSTFKVRKLLFGLPYCSNTSGYKTS